MRKLSTATVLLLAVFLFTGAQVSAQNHEFGTISGSVVEQDTSDPIEHAMVAAINPNGHPRPVAVAYTDEDGNYELEAPYGEFIVVAHAHHYMTEFWQEVNDPDEATVVTVGEDSNPSGINFTLTEQSGPSHGSIAGIVYEADTDEPIAHAMVELTKPDNNHFHMRTHTNQDGNYEFGWVPEGEYIITAVAEDFMPAEYPDLVIVGEEPVTDINLYLEPIVFGSISGVVTESNSGDQVAEATVILHTGHPHHAREAVTNETGAYMFDDIAPGTYHLVCVKEGYLPAEYPEPVEVMGEDVVDINFQLEVLEFGSISGIVYDADTEEPLGDAYVVAHMGGHHGYRAETMTAEDGTYTLDDLPPGEYHVHAVKQGYEMAEYPEVIEIDGNDVEDIDFVLEIRVITGIHGVVSDAATNEPVEHAFVIAVGGNHPHHHRWAVTNENGEYLIELGEGEYHIEAYAWGYMRFQSDEDVVVTDGLVTYDIALGNYELGSISGTVYDTEDNPIEDAFIEIRMNHGHHHRCARTDENGEYTIDELIPGDYRLRAFAMGYNHQSLEDLVTVGEGEDVTGIDFHLTEWEPEHFGVISGNVSDEITGDPLDEAMVVAIAPRHGHRHHVFRTHTDEMGNYTFEHLPEDVEYRLFAMAREYHPEFYNDKFTWHDADIVTPDAVDIDFALAPAEGHNRMIGGRINTIDVPIDGAIVMAYIDNEVVSVATTYPDGYYYLDNLVPGEYTLQVYSPTDGEATISVSALYEDVYDADVVLSPTDVYDDVTSLPSVTGLVQNYPNPFNATTNISFYLADNSEVELTVFDLLGRKVKTLVSGMLNAGQHTYTWNGLDENGQQISSGVYLYVLKTSDDTFTNRMVLLK